VERQKFINYDLEAHPLQIKTDSKTGSGDFLTLILYNNDTHDVTNYNDLGYFAIVFKDPFTYRIKHCTTEQTLTTVPQKQNKIWTITKTSNTLIIECNGVKVIDLHFQNADQTGYCVKKWSQDVAKIAFWNGGDGDDDKASDKYRMAPKTCTSLPDIANLEIESSKLPVEQGTEITVKCNEGFRLEGNNILTCNHGNFLSSITSCLGGKNRCKINSIFTQNSELCDRTLYLFNLIIET
jgi:hypothetical protein